MLCNGVRAVWKVSISAHKLEAETEILRIIYEATPYNISEDHKNFWTEIIKPLFLGLYSSHEDLLIGFIDVVLIL